MTTQSAVASDATQDPAEAKGDSVTPHSRGKLSITPAQRWELICEDVYARTQKRGFVGGDPLQDLVDAEKEIDANYETDFESVFSLRSTAEITKQLKGLFACYGFDQQHLESLLDAHQERLQWLAAMNRECLEGIKLLPAKQAEVLKEVANEAVLTLQSVTAGRIRPEGVFRVAELSMQTLDSALAGLQSLMLSSSIKPSDQVSDASGQSLLQDAIVSAYEGYSAKELTAAPLTALKGIPDSLGKRLEEEFAISTILDLASHPLVQWASGVMLLADAEDSAKDRSSRPTDAGSATRPGHRTQCQPVSDALLAEVRQISESQARLLREEFGIETVRDLARNRYFRIAQALVLLAQSES